MTTPVKPLNEDDFLLATTDMEYPSYLQIHKRDRAEDEVVFIRADRLRELFEEFMKYVNNEIEFYQMNTQLHDSEYNYDRGRYDSLRTTKQRLSELFAPLMPKKEEK